jgi:hypothetical protein
MLQDGCQAAAMLRCCCSMRSSWPCRAAHATPTAIRTRTVLQPPITHSCLTPPPCPLPPAGVRARQEKVPFATVDDPEFLSSKVRPLLGRQVMLRVSADSVSLTEDGNSSNGNGNGNGNGVSSRPSNNGKAAIAAAKIVRCKSFEVLPMQDCELATAGAKAAACAQLEQVGAGGAAGGGQQGQRAAVMAACGACCCAELPACLLSACVVVLCCRQAHMPAVAHTSHPLHAPSQIAVSAAGGGAGFRTPAGCSIPFGTLELALQQLPAVEQRRYDTLLTEIEAGEVSQLEGLCIELQDLILDKLRPAPAVLRAVTRLLGEEVQVICRWVWCGGCGVGGWAWYGVQQRLRCGLVGQGAAAAPPVPQE